MLGTISPTTEASGASLPRTATSSSRGFDAGAADALLDDELAVEAGGEVEGGGQFAAVVDFADADRGAQVRGLDEERVVAERLLDEARASFGIGRHSPRSRVTCGRLGQASGGEEALHGVLVHAGGGAEDAGADVGDVGEFEEALDGAVFAEGAVEDGEDDVERCGEGVACWASSALALSWRDFVFGDLSRTGAGFVSPARRRWASVEVSHWPCLLMPMGTTSYFLRSIALRMESAESRETSCSPERPPKRMPTRSLFFVGFFFMDSYKFLLVCCGAREKVGRGIEVGFCRGFWISTTFFAW